MKPYKFRKLTEYPDIADIQQEGRASHIGKLPEKSGEFKPYMRGTKRKRVRRLLKRADKQKQNIFDKECEE